MATSIAILWWLSGVSGFVFWWTKEYDLPAERSVILLCIFVGVMGAFSWILGAAIHGGDGGVAKANAQSKIIFKKRGE